MKHYIQSEKVDELSFHDDSVPTNMVNVPKTCWTFCKTYGKQQPHKVAPYTKR